MAQMVNVAGVMADSIVDGPGIRVAIFVQGCCHHCEGCHNPESWPFGAGTDMSVEDLFALVKANQLCRGVTFSGGEPFCQAGALVPLAEKLKAAGYELASYSGYTFEQLLDGTPEQKALLRFLDILVDGPFVLAQRNLDLLFRGSENQRIIDMNRTRAAGHIVLWEGMNGWK